MPAFLRSDALGHTLADQIDGILPQTQCTKCGYPGCRPYAEAIAFDDAPINQCPPGGTAGLQALARLTGSSERFLNPVHGTEKPLEVAVIDEAQCIGCTLCIAACPVDAIIGAPRLMHVVIAERCSGCDLCVAPCPMDCITMQPATLPWSPERRSAARSRFDGQAARRERIDALINAKRAARGAQDHSEAHARRRAAIVAAQASARARRAARGGPP